MIRIAAITVVLLALASVANAASEIVVAIRYLQAEGESHSHLFLYREDGTLLRQLTKEESGQDLDPIFAPDGETIVFTREMAENKFEYWSVEPKGGGLDVSEQPGLGVTLDRTALARMHERYRTEGAMASSDGHYGHGFRQRNAGCSVGHRWGHAARKTRRRWRTCPAQPCGFPCATRCWKGPPGFEPGTKEL